MSPVRLKVQPSKTVTVTSSVDSETGLSITEDSLEVVSAELTVISTEAGSEEETEALPAESLVHPAQSASTRHSDNNLITLFFMTKNPFFGKNIGRQTLRRLPPNIMNQYYSARLQTVPSRVSLMTMPLPASSSRMASAVAKSLFFLASLRASMRSMM